MAKSTSTPRPQQRYKGAQGALVKVEGVTCHRVTLYRDGSHSPCVQPLKRFTKELREMAQ